MKLKICVCDDMEEDIKYISSFVRDWADKKNIVVNIKSYSSAESFLFDYAEHKDLDILLLDIEMKSMSGVELAREIRKDNDTVQIVFITGFPDFVYEGYEVSALHYLMKPVSFEKLSQVLERAEKMLNKSEKSLFFTVDGENVRVPAGDVISVEAFAHFCTVTTKHSQIEVKNGITAIEKMLVEMAGEEFIRCHRSYIVGVKFIKSISKTEITLDNGSKIPVSRNNYQAVNQAFIRYFKGK